MAEIIAVTYFAALVDAAGCHREDLAVTEATVGGLRRAVAQRHGTRAGDLAALCCVLDGDELLRDDAAPISAAVDLLPPFAGG